MIHPIPPGTRDILPDEMRELRALQATLIEVFERFGYGQVATPTLEYDEVLQRGEGRSGVGAYRFFDERGELLALRSDMTIPIARLVASRFGVSLRHRINSSLRLAWFAQAETLHGAANEDSPLVRSKQDAGIGVSLIWGVWHSSETGTE